MNLSAAQRGIRTRLKTIVFNLMLAACYAWSGIWAVQDGSWGALAFVIAMLAIYGCLKAWLHRRRIDVDQHGQPASGRDADRLATLQLRAYQKNQRRTARR